MAFKSQKQAFFDHISYNNKRLAGSDPALPESTPAAEETPDQAVTLFDYHGLLSQTGWWTTHRIECPLSTERLTGTQVKRMQTKRILSTIGRTLLIARRT